MRGFCNAWVCVFVGFVMYGCFGNTYTGIYCVLHCLFCVFVLFMYMCVNVYCTTATGCQPNCS